MSIRGLTFGEALVALKGKQLCRRKTWARGQVVALITLTGYKPCLVLGDIAVLENRSQPGWLPGQEDLLAQDWEIITDDEY